MDRYYAMFGRDSCPCRSGSNSDRTNARSAAKTGAKIGAAAGAKAGPVGAGIGSGLGGATGFLAGAVIDDIEDSLDDDGLIPDGGRPHDADGETDEHRTAVRIPVTEADQHLSRRSPRPQRARASDWSEARRE